MFVLPRREFLKAGVAVGLGFGMSLELSRCRRASETTLERARRSKQITVGLANERPYGFVDADGKVTGAIVEVLRAALSALGITKIDANVVEFDALVPGLNANRFDVIGAGMYVRPTRCSAIAFTNPVTRSGGAFITKRGNPSGAHSLQDVAKKRTVKIGTQTGTSQVDEVKKAGVSEEQLVLFAKDTDALAGLQAGRVDVIYFPALEVNTLLNVAADPGIERVARYEQLAGADGKPAWNYQALALRKNDSALLDLLNEEISRLLRSGRLLELLSPFGYTANELPPPDVTATMLCAT